MADSPAAAGVNHCTWILRFAYDGRNMMPKLVRDLKQRARAEKDVTSDHSKARYNVSYTLQLYELYGAIPTAISHTKEYVPFFQGYGSQPAKPEPIALFDAERRQREMDYAWRVTKQYASGKFPVRKFLSEVSGDHASDIIEAMWADSGQPYYINTHNRGSVTNLPCDALLELRCDVDMRGPRPQPVGAMPRGLLAVQQQILDTHKLTTEAAITGDRAILRRAMLADPI